MHVNGCISEFHLVNTQWHSKTKSIVFTYKHCILQRVVLFTIIWEFSVWMISASFFNVKVGHVNKFNPVSWIRAFLSFLYLNIFSPDILKSLKSRIRYFKSFLYCLPFSLEIRYLNIRMTRFHLCFPLEIWNLITNLRIFVYNKYLFKQYNKHWVKTSL